MKKFQLKSFISGLTKNSFVSECGIPLGYKATYPIIKKENNKIFLTIPFNKTQKTKTPEVSAIMPIAYTVTFELHAVRSIPESIKKISTKEEGYSGATPIAFETLKYSEKYSKINFSQPLETFPHNDLKEIGKEEYKEKIDKLYTAYDIIINDYLGLEKASGVDRLEFKQLLDVLLSPVTKQMYSMIDENFSKEFLEKQTA